MIWSEILFFLPYRIKKFLDRSLWDHLVICIQLIWWKLWRTFISKPVPLYGWRLILYEYSQTCFSLGPILFLSLLTVYPHQLPAIALIAYIADLRSGIFFARDLKPKSNKDWFQISINLLQDRVNDSDAVSPERVRLSSMPVKPSIRKSSCITSQ